MVPRFINPHGFERVQSWSSPAPVVQPDLAVRQGAYIDWMRQGVFLTKFGSDWGIRPYTEFDNTQYNSSSDLAYLAYLRTPSVLHRKLFFQLMAIQPEHVGRLHFSISMYLVTNLTNTVQNLSKMDSTIFQMTLVLFDLHNVQEGSYFGEETMPFMYPLHTWYVAGSPVVVFESSSLAWLVREQATIPCFDYQKTILAVGDRVLGRDRYMLGLLPTLWEIGHPDIITLTLVSPGCYLYPEPLCTDKTSL